MANEIDKALIIQFSDSVHVEAQQMKARLRPYVKVKPMTGDVFAYDGLGSVEATEVAGRVVRRTFASIDHLRRKIARRRFEVTLPIDDIDVRAILLNPEQEYAAAIVRAMARRFDRVGVEAAFADVKTGRDFETTLTFAQDNGTTVNATSGLTYEKLLEINKNFHNAEVNNEVEEEQLLLITGDEEERMFQETELISGDFQRQFSVEKGKMVYAVGNKLTIYGADVNNPILAVSGSTRDNIAMVGRALCYGLSKEFSIKIEPRPDYVDLMQVSCTGILGAVRTEGKLIQKVQTTTA